MHLINIGSVRTYLKANIVSFSCLLPALGAAGRAEGPQRVLCSEGAEEGRGTDGRRRGVHDGGEEGASVSLGKPLPHTPLFHHSDQGEVQVLK